MRHPLAVPLVLALVCAATAWSALSPPVDLGSASRSRDTKKDGNKEESSKPDISLSRDLFSPPASYSYSLQGVYSMDGTDYAIINGSDAKVGDRVGQATVTEITAEVVKIKEDGKESPTELRVFGKGESEGGGGEWEGGGRIRGGPPMPPDMPSNNKPPKPPKPPKEKPPVSSGPSPEPVKVEKSFRVEWDWSTWPGPPQMLDELKSRMSDPEKRIEAKAEWEKMKAMGERPPEITDEMVEWIDKCFAHYESNP